MSNLRYTPLSPPQDEDGVVKYLHAELLRIAQFINLLSATAIGQMNVASPPVNHVVATATPTTINLYDAVSEEDNISANSSTGEFTVLQGNRYGVNFTTSVSASSNNTTLTFSIAVDGTPLAGADALVFLKTSGEFLPVSGFAHVTAEPGQVISIEVSHTEGANRTVTYEALGFAVEGELFI